MLTSVDIQALVNREIDEWQMPVVEPGTTLGMPWGAERYLAEIEQLRQALVTPYRQCFELRETYEQMRMRVAPESTYWVVAATDDWLVWFDEDAAEFGLASFGVAGALPVSIYPRGDLIGVFCAR